MQFRLSRDERELLLKILNATALKEKQKDQKNNIEKIQLLLL